MTTFRNPLVDPLGTHRGPPLVRGPQFENRCGRVLTTAPNINVGSAMMAQITTPAVNSTAETQRETISICVL